MIPPKIRKRKSVFSKSAQWKKLGNTFPGLNCCDEDGDALNCSGTFSLGYRSFRTGVRTIPENFSSRSSQVRSPCQVKLPSHQNYLWLRCDYSSQWNNMKLSGVDKGISRYLQNACLGIFPEVKWHYFFRSTCIYFDASLQEQYDSVRIISPAFLVQKLFAKKRCFVKTSILTCHDPCSPTNQIKVNSDGTLSEEQLKSCSYLTAVIRDLLPIIVSQIMTRFRRNLQFR